MANEQIPRQIGPYKIETLLDKGGMSLLYLGIHPQTREPLAVKTLSSKFVSHPEMVQQFMHEAQIIEITNHPNIIQLLGHGEWDEGVYIATEFIQGISLRQMILSQAMSLKRALEVVMQIGHALTHLHVHGIIHRDLKPENILLTAQGGVKVIDFGISQLYTAKTGEEMKRLLGTPAYMSPEQRQNPANVTFSSDIYSLGVITYELILGRLSHGTVHLSMMPKHIQPILSKALQPDPKNRYEDIVDFVKALSDYYKSEKVKQDMRGTDYMGELNEDIKEAQALLIPSQPPKWAKAEVGFSSNWNMALSAVYYDFFQQKDGVYNVVMAESDSTGIEGVLQVAMLRGMVHALAHGQTTPKDFVRLLNQRVCALNERLHFSFSYLTLFPQQARFAFIALGAPPLWYLPVGSKTPQPLSVNHPSLGSRANFEVLEMDGNWNIGDKVLLHTFQSGGGSGEEQTKIDEAQFCEAVREHLFLPPKKQTEAITRRLLSEKGRNLLEEAITVISCERTA